MPKPYVSIPGQDCWLAGQQEQKLLLNDSSAWEIAPDYREQVDQWIRFSPISVRFSDTTSFPYVLSNRSLGQEARASFVGMEYRSAKPQPASAFVTQLPHVLANVGLFIALVAVALLLAAPSLGDASVRQIGSRVYPILLRPGSLIASQIFRTAHYSWSILFVNWLFYAFVVLCLGAVGLRKRA